MINIDELKYNFDKPFLDLMDGIETMVHPKHDFVTIFHKKNKLWSLSTLRKKNRIKKHKI